MCPLATGFTGEKRMFWPPPRHNKQRDRRERSGSCYLVPHLSFKQKTSLFDTAFSRRVASKLGIFEQHLRPSVTLFMRMFKREHCSSKIKIKHPLRSILFTIMFIIMFIIHHLHHYVRHHRRRPGHLPLQPLRQLFQRLNTQLSNLAGRTCLHGL